jgi:hypothetical protein
MRWAAFLLLLLVAPAFVRGQNIGQIANAGCGSATSCSVAFAGPISAGEGILIGAFINPSVQNCNAPTDNNLDTFTQVAAQRTLPNFPAWGACFWAACNVSVALHNPPTVTANYSAAAATNIRVMELQHAAPACLDQGQSTTIANTGAANTPFFSPAATTTKANELIVGLALADNGTLSAGAGTNYLDPGGPSPAAIIFNGYSVNVIASYTSSFSSNAPNDDALIFMGTFVAGTPAKKKHPPYIVRFRLPRWLTRTITAAMKEGGAN